MKKKLLLLFALLLAAALPLRAQNGTEIGGLYYTLNPANHTATVTYPGNNSSSPWTNFTKPTGALVIPGTVSYNGQEYTVISIGDHAFYYCTGITTVTIPNSVSTVGGWAFYGCSGLQRVDYTGTIAQWCGISFPTSFSNPLFYAYHLYLDNQEVTSLVIPNTVTKIGDYAFIGCSGLTSATIPNTVDSIGRSAFEGCSGLASVTIPNSVTSIGIRAFENCSGLTSVTIGNSVTTIGNASFRGCIALTSVNIPNSVTSIEAYAFYGCSGLASVTLGSSVASIGMEAFQGCSGLQTVNYNATNCTFYSSIQSSSPFYCDTSIRNVTIGDNVTTIPNCFMYGCSGLTSVNIPEAVTSIGSHAFYYCSSLTTVTIPNAVTSMGRYAFSFCSGLQTVNYNATDCTFPDNAYGAPFSSNDSLRNVIIGNNVTTIPRYFMYRCIGLTSVTIPSSVTTIGENAFLLCDQLDSIICLPATPPTIDVNTFSNEESAILIVPCGLTNLYSAAAHWSHFTHIVDDCDNILTLTLAANNPDWGTVEGGGIYLAGTTATLTAIPNDGYRFVMWMNGPTDNPRTVVVTENATYTALFAEETSTPDTLYYTLTVASNNPAWGTVQGGGTYEEGSEVTLTAVPAEGYRFVMWMDGPTDNPRTITVTENATYTAIFAEGNSQGISEAEGEVLAVEYFDLMGRQLAAEPDKGLYLVRTITAQGASTRKIIKQ